MATSQHDVSAMATSQHDVSAMATSQPDVSAMATSQHDVSAMATSQPDVSAMATSQHDVSAMATSQHDVSAMATSQPDVSAMKKELNKITKNIDSNLYQKILLADCAPQNTINEFNTAKLYYIEQLIQKTLNPWNTASCLRGFNFENIAKDFEQFALMFNFTRGQSLMSTPETCILELLQYLKKELSIPELLAIRVTKSKTFEDIFREFLSLGKLTPSLTELRTLLQDEDREDLATYIVNSSQITTKIDQSEFNRTVQLCLDTLDTNIFLILQELKSALSRQHSDFHMLDEDLQTADIEHNYIDLTFTKEVDTRTLPLTEGSDAELKTLINNASLRSKEKMTQYVNALSEINSYSNSGKLISVIGHPGTGKTLFCRKLINQYSHTETDTHRYVLLITCRNSDWHILEDQSMSTPGNKLDKLKLFLQVLIPTFSKQNELAEIIITSEGKGLLLIIDSFDEFPQYQKFDATFLYQLLSRNILSQSTLLITSRPGAWNQLLRSYGNKFKLDYSWQLIGFSVEQRDQFIDKMLTHEKIITLKQVLNTKPELNLLTLVPVNISLITGLILHSVYISDLRTLTDVYTRLVLYTLDKQHKRLSKQSAGINSYAEMPQEMKKELFKLAELSYSGLQNRQITFPAAEMPNIMDSGTKYSKGLGLFHTIKVTSKQLTVIDYLSCPHLTLQEYLAALHLSQKPTNEIIVTIVEIFSTSSWPAMKVCIRFLCGLLKNGQQVIINILITKLQLKPAPAFACELLNMVDRYTSLHAHITASHLSIIPYILETEDPSLLSAYYTQLSPTTSTCPHFYLYPSISPVELYSLCECFTLLPANSSISTLHIYIHLLDSTQLLMLAQAIATIQLHKLIVRLVGRDEARDISAIEQLPNSIADISYELQQLHDTNRHTLINEFQQYADQPTLQEIYKLRCILLSSKLTVASLTLLTDANLLKKFHGFINTISNQTSKQQEHIYYRFNNIQFMNASMNAELLSILSPTATYVMFWDCYYPIEWARHIISQPNLMYIQIRHANTAYLKKLNNQLLAPEALLSNIGKQTFKGLILDLRLSIQESIVHEFIKTQHCLEEIRLFDTTNLLEALTAIQHITTLKALEIFSRDDSEQCQSLFLNILIRNHQTLSYVSIYPYCVISHVRLTERLSLCTNLQTILFFYCLTPQLMAPVTTVINQLHSLVYLNMFINAITDEGMAIFSQTLSLNTNIRCIMLHECQLTVLSIPAIINIIHTCYNLQHLNLKNNDFKNETNDLKKLCEKRNIKLLL